MGLPDERTVRRHRVPAAITGLVECIFFVVLVAGDAGGAGAIMIGWLAAKIAANWGQPVVASQDPIVMVAGHLQNPKSCG
jgi:hypothetical protein